ncbi:MAG: hypothetical protein ACI8UO_003399 [Verrucomicrobiales bacterium]|jgi:hypothetical protein
MTRIKLITTVLLATNLLMNSVSLRSAPAQTPTESMGLDAETFSSIHEQIRPQPGESRWMEIPWLTDLHDARKKAAAEGKPLFLSVSGKGLSIGMC